MEAIMRMLQHGRFWKLILTAADVDLCGGYIKIEIMGQTPPPLSTTRYIAAMKDPLASVWMLPERPADMPAQARDHDWLGPELSRRQPVLLRVSDQN